MWRRGKEGDNIKFLPIPIPYLNDKLSISAVNTLNTCGVSGEVEEIKNLQAKLLNNNIACKLVDTEYAFHSYMMDSISDEFLNEVKKIKFNAPQIPYISNVTGSWVGMEVTDPKYWVKHLRQPVRFFEGIKNITERMDCILIEIGPSNTLSSFALQIISSKEAINSTVQVVDNRTSTEGCNESLLRAIGKLWGMGIEVDWEKYNDDRECYRLELPTYPFERKKYYISPNMEGDTLDNDVSSYKKDGGKLFFFNKGFKQIMVPNKINLKDEELPWAVIINGNSFSIKFINYLKTLKEKVIVIKSSDNYKKVSELEFLINKNKIEDYINVFQELSKDNLVPNRIINMISLDEERNIDIRNKTEMPQEDVGIITMLKGIDFIGAKLNVSVVTNNNYQMADSKDNINGSYIPEITDVISREIANIKYRNVDVNLNESDCNIFERIIIASLYECEENQIIIRNKKYWVQQYINFDINDSSLEMINASDDDGCIIINRKKEEEKELTSPFTNLVFVDLNELSSTELESTFVKVRNEHKKIKGIYYCIESNLDITPVNKIDIKNIENKLGHRLESLNRLKNAISGIDVDFVLIDLPVDYEIGFYGKAINKIENKLIVDFVDSMGKENNNTNWMIINWKTKASKEDKDDIFDFYIEPEYRGGTLKNMFNFGLEKACITPIDISNIKQLFKMRNELDGSNIIPLYERPNLEMEYIPPRNEIDEAVSEVWRNILGVKEIGIKDDFFSLGGNSLLALQIIYQINQYQKIEIPMAEFLSNPTVAFLSDYIESITWIREEQCNEEKNEKEENGNEEVYTF